MTGVDHQPAQRLLAADIRIAPDSRDSGAASQTFVLRQLQQLWLKEKAMDIKKLLEDFDAAYNNAFDQGDAAGCAAFFAEDVILMAPDQPMVRGREAFEKIYRSRMDESSGGTHSNELVDYGVEGDLAYQVGTFAITGTNPSEQGKFVNILKREADGSWKVAVSIFNSDKP